MFIFLTKIILNPNEYPMHYFSSVCLNECVEGLYTCAGERWHKKKKKTFIDFGICTISTAKSSFHSLQMSVSIVKYERHEERHAFSSWFRFWFSLLFINETQQAAFVFVLINANEHPD